MEDEKEFLVKIKCKRCGYKWFPRLFPKQCPKCKSYYWDEDRKLPHEKKHRDLAFEDTDEENHIKDLLQTEKR